MRGDVMSIRECMNEKFARGLVDQDMARELAP